MILREELIEIKEIVTGKVDITDPSYTGDSSFRISDILLPAGKYELICYKGWDFEPGEADLVKGTGIDHLKDLRRRVFALVVKKQSNRNIPLSSKRWKKIGQIGVDSSIAGIFWNPYEFADDDAWFDFCDELNGNDVIADDCGFYCNSGYGDGIYDVFAIKKNDDIIALRIDF